MNVYELFSKMLLEVTTVLFVEESNASHNKPSSLLRKTLFVIVQLESTTPKPKANGIPSVNVLLLKVLPFTVALSTSESNKPKVLLLIAQFWIEKLNASSAPSAIMLLRMLQF